MRCPGRGRKQMFSPNPKLTKYLFGNEMPRKGTETGINPILLRPVLDLEMRCPGRGRKHSAWYRLEKSMLRFGNEMPRKGTETRLRFFGLDWVHIKFGNEMPRKGTETHAHVKYFSTRNPDLEMRCPGRGRKLKFRETDCNYICWFGNEMPRKGTETFLPWLLTSSQNYLEMRCPGRGRKHVNRLSSIFFEFIWKWDAPEGDGNLYSSPPHVFKWRFGNEMPRKGTETLTAFEL